MSEIKILNDQYSINDIMDKIENGECKIPRFQREFVWPANKVIKLALSIDNNFPIGVFTVWKHDGSSISGRNEVIEKLSDEKYKKTSDLVIDGQQRITSICIIYFAPQLIKMIDNGEFSKKTGKQIKDTISNVLFYENNFILKKDLIKKFKSEKETTINSKIKITSYQISIKEVNEEIRKKISSYNLFFLTIQNAKIPEVIKIFTVMNSETKPLTHVDLMNGSMFNVSGDSFDLLNFIKKANAEWSNFGKIKEGLFSILIKIYSDFKIDDKYETSYKSGELVEWSNDSVKVKYFIEEKNQFINKLKETISVFERIIHIYSIKNIPKDVYFISVFSLITKIEPSDKNFKEYLWKIIHHITKRMVWGDYASSPNAKALDDINKFIMKIVDNEEPKMEIFPYHNVKNIELIERVKINFKDSSYKKKGSGIFKLIISILSAESPYNFYEDTKVPIQPTETTKLNTDIHHFIPSKSKMANTYHMSDRLDRIGNLVLITPEENKKISNLDINEYICDAKKERTTKSTSWKKVMDSHFINMEDIDKLIDEYEKYEEFQIQNSIKINELVDRFIENREECILNKLLHRFLGINEFS